MKSIIDESIGTIVFVFIALIYIFVLGVLGGSFGGVAEEVSKYGINSILFLVLFILALPPIAFIIWIINQVKQSSRI
jgi:hypothetical protein